MSKKRTKSEELLLQVYQSKDPSQAKVGAMKALKMDPTNPNVYTFLGTIEHSIEKALAYFEKAIDFAKMDIEEEFDSMKGHFWGFHETRPFMRAKMEYARCLILNHQQEESINQYLEMLELNPNDNQGVRYEAVSLLIYLKKTKEFDKLIADFGTEDSSAAWQFALALNEFQKEGATKNANGLLKQAHESNVYVIPLLLGLNQMPQHLPAFYGFGDENEATTYCATSGWVWQEFPEAQKWIEVFYKRSKKMNIV